MAAVRIIHQKRDAPAVAEGRHPSNIGQPPGVIRACNIYGTYIVVCFQLFRPSFPLPAGSQGRRQIPATARPAPAPAKQRYSPHCDGRCAPSGIRPPAPPQAEAAWSGYTGCTLPRCRRNRPLRRPRRKGAPTLRSHPHRRTGCRYRAAPVRSNAAAQPGSRRPLCPGVWKEAVPRAACRLSASRSGTISGSDIITPGQGADMQRVRIKGDDVPGAHSAVVTSTVRAVSPARPITLRRLPLISQTSFFPEEKAPLVRRETNRPSHNPPERSPPGWPFGSCGVRPPRPCCRRPTI